MNTIDKVWVVFRDDKGNQIGEPFEVFPGVRSYVNPETTFYTPRLCRACGKPFSTAPHIEATVCAGCAFAGCKPAGCKPGDFAPPPCQMCSKPFTPVKGIPAPVCEACWVGRVSPEVISADEMRRLADVAREKFYVVRIARAAGGQEYRVLSESVDVVEAKPWSAPVGVPSAKPNQATSCGCGANRFASVRAFASPRSGFTRRALIAEGLICRDCGATRDVVAGDGGVQ